LSNWEELKDQKLTKSETLKAAILYIQHLEELIQDDNINSTIKPNRSTPTRMIKSEEEQQPFSPPLSSSVTFADLLLFETVPKQHEGNIIINQQQQDVLLPQQSQYLLQKNLPQSQYHHHCHSHSHNSSRSATPSSYMLYANGNPTTIESSHSHNQLSPQFVLMSQTSSYPPNSLCCQQQNFSRYHNQTAVMPLTIRNETNSQQHIPHNYHQHHYGEAFETPNATDFKPHRSF
jgi:hypothetical protein